MCTLEVYIYIYVYIFLIKQKCYYEFLPGFYILCMFQLINNPTRIATILPHILITFLLMPLELVTTVEFM